jgi:AraC-like DNA-binding protein
MKTVPKNIKFKNTQNSNTQFDIIKLEDLYQRTDLNHSIEDHHKVEFFILLFIENGKGYHTIDFTDYKCIKGTLLTIRKDQIHKFFINSNLKGSLLLFTSEFLANHLEKTETLKTMLLFNELLGVPKLQLDKKDFEVIGQIVKRVNNEYYSIKDKHSLSIIRSELHILITLLFRIKSEKDQSTFKKKYLNEFIEFQELIESNITQTTKVQDFAKKMNVSTKTLNNVTKNIIHKSAKEFIDEICTKQIKRLLINTNLSIKEVAYQSGFEETTNFYKYFKRQTQTTPEQFRVNF